MFAESVTRISHSRCLHSILLVLSQNFRLLSLVFDVVSGIYIISGLVPTMPLTVLLSLVAIQISLLVTAAPNLKTYTENTRKPSNVISAASSLPQPNPTCLLKSLTSGTPKISSAPLIVAPSNGTLPHSHVGSLSSGSSAFIGSKTGLAIGFKNSTHHCQPWNTSSESSRISVTVSNCSKSMQHITPEPKCSCPYVQTITVFVTVTATATARLDHANLGNTGSQILPSVPALTHETALGSSFEALPSISFSQRSSLSSTATGRSGHPVEQASSPQNVSTRSASLSSYLPNPNNPTMSPTMLPTNAKPLGTIASKSASTIPIGSAMKSSTTLRSCSKTKFSSDSNPPVVSLQMSSASASLQTTFHSRPGGSILDLAPTQGQSSYISTALYPSNSTTLSVMSGSSTGTPSQYSAHKVSLQSSIIESYSGQSFTSPSSSNNYPAPPATALVPSFTLPPTLTDSPNATIVSLSAIYPPPIESQTPTLPSNSSVSPSPVISSNTAISKPAAMLPNPVGPPYPNISQALNMTTFGLPTGHPQQTHNTANISQGPHSSSLPYNGSLHPVICLPNTVSITHILANVRLFLLRTIISRTFVLI